ncbi:MAG TPA: superoxide dismutase [Steroidobacteraceae bacterium]|nr:superoxide dismutase [Steroidobacteraceae bacterium]
MSTDVSQQTYPFTLPPLPYANDALEPHIDGKTLQIHHDKHHQTYVTKLNEALEKQPSLHSLTLTELLKSPDKLPDAVRTAVKNNGGGHLLHDIFWNAMSPQGAREPQGELAAALTKSFGSFADFKKKFADASAKHFASGWVALGFDPKSKALEIADLKDHETLVPRGLTTLLILDVWEHAYYLKYQNRRPEFIDAFWNVVNWDYAAGKFR